jgi:hypothetical protein
MFEMWPKCRKLFPQLYTRTYHFPSCEILHFQTLTCLQLNRRTSWRYLRVENYVSRCSGCNASHYTRFLLLSLLLNKIERINLRVILTLKSFSGNFWAIHQAKCVNKASNVRSCDHCCSVKAVLHILRLCL